MSGEMIISSLMTLSNDCRGYLLALEVVSSTIDTVFREAVRVGHTRIVTLPAKEHEL